MAGSAGIHFARACERRAPSSRAPLVIFGATGDLTHRKLLPALYDLAIEQPLPPQFSVVGVARRPFIDDEFRAAGAGRRQRVTRGGGRSIAVGLGDLLQGAVLLPVQFDDIHGYERLGELLDQLDRERGTRGNRIFYLATPPSFYPDIGDC